MGSKKVFITGCARSGTTLLARMFHAFEDASVVQNEIPLVDFVRHCAENSGLSEILVGKRTEHSIFSNVISEWDINNSLRLIKENDIIIINCVRDGRFVVDSWRKAWGVYNPFAWMTAILQAKKHKNVIKLTVKYEDLINDSLSVQREVEKLLGIKTHFNFSNYPDFVPDSSMCGKCSLNQSESISLLACTLNAIDRVLE
jgi:hypothetical protein